MKPSMRVGPKPRRLCVLDLPSPLAPVALLKAPPEAATASLAFIVRQIDARLTIPLQCLTNFIGLVPKPGGGERPIVLQTSLRVLWSSCHADVGRAWGAARAQRVSGTLRLEVAAPCSSQFAGGFCKRWGVILGEYWDLQKFCDSIDVRQLLGFEAECGFPTRVAVVDLHLLLSALRWAGAHAKPRMVANSTLAGSKFLNACARNGICTAFHRTVPFVRVDQHVDDLAQRVVGRQTAVIEQMVEAAEIITFACDRLNLVISPSRPIVVLTLKTESIFRRGLLELGFSFGFARRTRDLGVDMGGGSRRAVGVMRKRLCKAAKRGRRLAAIRRHTMTASALHSTNIAPSSVRGIRSRAADAVCPKHGGCVSSSIAISLLNNADPAVQAGIECVKQWSVHWQTLMNRTRVRRTWKLSLEQLRDGMSRWMKVRGAVRAVVCVLFDGGWFPLQPTNWKQAGREGVYWSFTSVGHSAELIQDLSRGILSRCVGPVWRPIGMEKVLRKGVTSPLSSSICVFIFYEKRENHAVYGALLTAAAGPRRLG